MKSRRGFLRESLALCAFPYLGGCLSRHSGDFSFVMFNDTHEHVRYFSGLAAHGPVRSSLTVFAGDILDDVRNDGSVERCLVSPLGDMAQRFCAPVHFVRGNRETRGPAAAGLWRKLGYLGERYYSAKSVGGVRFVFLDTCESRRGGPFPDAGGSAYDAYLRGEKIWLEREIASEAWKSARARIAVMHIPPPVRNVDRTSSERVPVINPTKVKAVLELQNTLLPSGVDAVFAGHIHMGSFDMPRDDRPYPVIVGGGSRVDPVYPVEPLLTVCDFGRGEFTVRQTALDGKTRREQVFRI